MRGGQLHHLVTLQEAVVTRDAIGQPVKEWADVSKLFADIRYLSGLESVKADTSLAVTRASVRIRYRSDVVPEMRLLRGATVYDIKSVLPDQSGRRHLDLVVETGENQG